MVHRRIKAYLCNLFGNWAQLPIDNHIVDTIDDDDINIDDNKWINSECSGDFGDSKTADGISNNMNTSLRLLEIVKLDQ